MTSPIRVSDEDTIFFTIHAFPDLLAQTCCLYTEACRLTLALTFRSDTVSLPTHSSCIQLSRDELE